MPKTLLQIINQVQGDRGLTQSATVVGNNDPTTTQLYNLLLGLNTELKRMHRWKACEAEGVINVLPATLFTGNTTINSNVISSVAPNPLSSGVVPQLFVVDGANTSTEARVTAVTSSTITMSMVATSTQTSASLQVAQDTYAFPSDFDYFTNRTFWDRTNRWELLGPDSPQLDQWHRSGIVVTGPRRHFRKVGPYSNGQFRVWPSPLELVVDMEHVFEYTSLNTVAIAGAATSSAPNFAVNFTSDADTPLLDDDLLIKGLIWKFFEAKGFNYINLKNDWLDYVETMWARDGARPTLSIVKRVHPIFISPANVQDGFFPGPVGPNQA